MRTYLLIAAAIILPGGSILAFAAWLRRRMAAQRAAEVAAIGDLIVPPNKVYEGHDDQLRLNSEARRAIANDRRRQAQSIESGKPVESKIRIVGSR